MLKRSIGRMKGMKRASIAAAALLTLASPAHAACVSPVAQENSPRPQWADLERMAVPASLNSAIRDVQTLSAAGGDINTDYYSIRIDTAGQTPEQLMAELPANFGAIVFANATGQAFGPYDAGNGLKWNSPTPTGSLMSFVLETTFTFEERGSVVTSCISPTDWVFTTVTTAKDGLHPVSGNRAFGVVRGGNDSLVIFTKGVDRVVDYYPYKLARETAFGKGHAVWMQLMANLAQRYSARHPVIQPHTSRRQPY
jgi:hypothetical protein